jgi:hypothetical protein
MNKIQLSWELLNKVLLPAKQYADDRAPTVEETGIPSYLLLVTVNRR